jgi:beta-glucosidase
MLPGGVDGVEDRTRFSAVLHGELSVPDGGRYQLGLLSAGLSRLYLDDELVIDNWTSQTPGDAFFGNGSTERRAAVMLTPDQPHRLRMEFRSRPGLMLQGLRFGLLPPQPDEPIGEAVQVAAAADAVVLVVGSNPDWETEGNDRTDLALPGDQDELIRRVIAANPDTAVVVNTGAAVAMPWLAEARCVLQAWLPGQEFGNALADIVRGAVNPSGRMPTTFPVRLEDTPAFEHYPGSNGRVEYGEGLLVGYRWYDTRDIAPLVPFGHGLSYTRFDYDRPVATVDGDGVIVTLGVANAGERDGSEVVQIYRRLSGAPPERPAQELCAFARVEVPRGASRDVDLRVPAENLRTWDATRGAWARCRGVIEFAVGASSRDIRHVVEVDLP